MCRLCCLRVNDILVLAVMELSPPFSKVEIVARAVSSPGLWACMPTADAFAPDVVLPEMED